MRLYYDNIIFSLQKIGGISSYWYELSKQALIDSSIDLRVYENPYSMNNILRNELNIDSSMLTVEKTHILSRLLPLKISSQEEFVFHSSYYRYVKNPKAKVVTTVHDFIQENTSSKVINLNSIMKSRAINHSDKIIAISENTKRDILKFYPRIDERNITVIYNGVSDHFFPLEGSSETSKLRVLYVGSRVDYKNFWFVVEIISKLKYLHLDIVGNELSKAESSLLAQKLKPDRWTLHIRPSNIKLNKLYNQSLCLIYPSNYEGFGIPIIEAMKSGCPVIALNKSSIPEVSGNAALLIDQLRIDDFCDGINLINEQRESYVVKGIKNAARFSWDKTYLETKKAYKN